jgi:hypothetical protein
VLRPTDTGCGNKRTGGASTRLCRAFKSATIRQTAASLARVRPFSRLANLLTLSVSAAWRITNRLAVPVSLSTTHRQACYRRRANILDELTTRTVPGSHMTKAIFLCLAVTLLATSAGAQTCSQYCVLNCADDLAKKDREYTKSGKVYDRDNLVKKCLVECERRKDCSHLDIPSHIPHPPDIDLDEMRRMMPEPKTVR